MVLAALVAFGSGAAQAAPQVLALIATNGKVDLVREGRACSAELTSFCLDAGRFSPAPGTAYHLAGAADVRLVGTAADGRSLSLDPQAFLRFESARSHVGVRVANRMINLLPPGGASGEFGGEAPWRRATQASGPDDLSPEARKRARGAFGFCRVAVNSGGASSLRRCLQGQHDRFIDFLNSEYWDAVKAGS